MRDLAAYLERIELEGEPDLAAVHRAHATSIPFENLDPRRGVRASLAPADLERKLVGERRGGYCFEQNLLLKCALEALGARVEPMLARVRLGADPGVVRPRSHLLLRVLQGGLEWHADVGFGLGTPLEPLPFGAGGEHEQAGWRFRIVKDERELVLQCVEGERWVDMYGFVPEPVPFADLETSNWWTSTSPSSPFVTGLIVSRPSADGTRVTLSDWGELALTERSPHSRRVTPLTHEQIPGLLSELFGLDGFELDGDGRLFPQPSR